MRAVFLDRDGTINREADNLRDVRDLKLLPNAAKAICLLNKIGLLVIIITNQPVVARGWLTEGEVEAINDILLKRLQKKGAKIDDVFYCPHHPDASLSKYRQDCDCRKPNIGMIKSAVKKYKINLSKSFLVGDSTRDILTGQRAGLKTVLVKTGYGGKDGIYNAEPDATTKNLLEAAEIIEKWQTK